MNKESIQHLFDSFDHSGNLSGYRELISGHINDTFLIQTDGPTNYVLQRINHQVFKNVPKLVNNKVLVSQHLKKKTKGKVLEFVPLRKDSNFCLQQDGSFWNLMIYIQDSVTYTVVPNREIAFEAGKLLGNFLNQTADLDASLLHDVIPNFHNMNFRFQQFKDAFAQADSKRLALAKPWISQINRLEKEMLILQHLKDEGKISIRVTHNDTKVSNCLFDTNDKGICMIDTDTVMQGIIHYDFGDALRSACNSAKEDETDLDKITFNVDFYHSYKEGFLEKVSDSLSALEIELLPLSVKTMIFIMGLRFLTDFLNNDLYYKTDYPNHNLDRAINQFTLIRSLENQSEKL
ncbi:MAG: phosphotransferase [Flavobacteriaceae bacterium]|nr:phosphotransferase [Flavobacteriaceae bacterium]